MRSSDSPREERQTNRPEESEIKTKSHRSKGKIARDSTDSNAHQNPDRISRRTSSFASSKQSSITPAPGSSISSFALTDASRTSRASNSTNGLLALRLDNEILGRRLNPKIARLQNQESSACSSPISQPASSTTRASVAAGKQPVGRNGNPAAQKGRRFQHGSVS